MSLTLLQDSGSGFYQFVGIRLGIKTHVCITQMVAGGGGCQNCPSGSQNWLHERKKEKLLCSEPTQADLPMVPRHHVGSCLLRGISAGLDPGLAEEFFMSFVLGQCVILHISPCQRDFGLSGQTFLACAILSF